jgi:D-proline reductase (dithiol) PrdB
MAQLSELPLWMQVFMKTYRYRQAEWTHGAAPKPLRESRVALVTTAGLYTKEQPPFDSSIKGGDCSYRWIPGDVAVQELLIAHRSKAFDHAGIELDRNLCFPLDRFRELLAEGEIGALNGRHLSFMGSITAPGRLTRQTAPEAAEQLKQDGVDVAFLTPV